MALGRGMEDEILRHVVNVALDVEGGGSSPTYVHDTEPRMTATPDGWVKHSDGRLSTIEIKFTASRTAVAEWTAMQEWLAGDAGAFPTGTAVEGYYVQIQAQMEVLDVDDGYLCVCIGERAALKLQLKLDVTDDEVRILRIKRDRELGAMMVKSVSAFWSRYVDAGVCPATTDEDLEALRKAWPVAAEGSSVTRRELKGLVRKWEHDKAKSKEFDKKARAKEARIRASIGTAETVDLGGGYVMTAKTTRRNNKAREASTSEFRTLRVKAPKRGTA
jgi:hypothetical protein